MRLKKALEKAKQFGYKYVAVDADLQIYIYLKQRPKVDHCLKEWDHPKLSPMTVLKIGTYTGKKDWKDTLREIN